MTNARQEQFAPRASSVAAARAMVRRYLTDVGWSSLLDTAELIVSEVVTNALVHAGTRIDVVITQVDDRLRVEVTDGSPHHPAAREYGNTAATGRGVKLLDELVAAWGVTPRPPGKTVWFTVSDKNAQGSGRSSSRAESAGARDDSVVVRLLDVPLLLCEAWRQHAESLLREHLLASLDLDAETGEGADTFASHAAAGDALNLLAEQVPPSRSEIAAAEATVVAVETWETVQYLEVLVPRATVDHFETLESMLSEAVASARAGEFLSPPTQPEVEALRSWLCAEVRRQHAGSDPTPWRAHVASDAATVRRAPAWDDWVTHAQDALVAADDHGRIVAVSAEAAEVLRCENRNELVGARLVSMIPERFHQAHVAGFSLYFLTGRAPLINRTIVAPLLTRSGVEVTVDLSVGAERTTDGSVVFVARLRPHDG